MRFLPNTIGIAIGLLLLAGQAVAQDQDPPEITSQFGLNTFQPASSPADGFAMEHAEVLDSLQFGVQALIQIDDDPLTWKKKKSDGTYARTAVASERLIVLHLNAVMGFLKYGQICLYFPAYLDMGFTNNVAGPGDLSIIPKGAYRFRTEKADFGLALLFPISLPTGDADHQMGEGTVTFGPKISADVVLGMFRIIFNTGVIWREEQTRNLVRGTEWLLGLGVEYDILRHPGYLRAILEIDTATQTGDFFSRNSAPTVILGGIKYRFINGIGLAGSMGAGLTPGVGTPDFRLVLGANYIFGIGKTTSYKPPKPPDADGDTVYDRDDKCPNRPEDFDEFEDEDGCPDADNDQDGISDAEDQCPNQAESFNNASDEDGCPDYDRDGDTVIDIRDYCLWQKEDLDNFKDDDGCPDDDNDADGIADSDDSCPLLPESINEYQDGDGCPDYFRMDGHKIVLKQPIRFLGKTADLHKSALKPLEELAMAIVANPSWTEVTIIVHTSGLGQSSSKKALSEERAMTVMLALVSSGVIPDRLIAVGKGNSEPLTSPDTKRGQRKNARVDFRIRKGAVQ